jgi:hypothetical protein
VQRAVERRRSLDRRIGVLVREVRVTLVAELSEDHEDLVGPLLLQLDVLVVRLARRGQLLLRRGLLVGLHGRGLRAQRLADLDDGDAVLLDRLGLAADDVRDRLGPERAALGLQRVGKLVDGLVDPVGLGVRW